MSPPGNEGTEVKPLICSCREGEALNLTASGGRGVRDRITQLQAREKPVSVIGLRI